MDREVVPEILDGLHPTDPDAAVVSVDEVMSGAVKNAFCALRPPGHHAERDLALGARWSLNDMADSQALLGIIRDVDTDEYVYSLEASRRLGASWTLLLEARVFGAREVDGLVGGRLHQALERGAPLRQLEVVAGHLHRHARFDIPLAAL